VYTWDLGQFIRSTSSHVHTVTNTVRKHTLTREQTYVTLRMYEHMRSVFPPIEQASAFTFAGHISAHGSILTLSIGWRRYLK